MICAEVIKGIGARIFAKRTSKELLRDRLNNQGRYCKPAEEPGAFRTIHSAKFGDGSYINILMRPMPSSPENNSPTHFFNTIRACKRYGIRDTFETLSKDLERKLDPEYPFNVKDRYAAETASNIVFRMGGYAAAAFMLIKGCAAPALACGSAGWLIYNLIDLRFVLKNNLFERPNSIKDVMSMLF